MKRFILLLLAFALAAAITGCASEPTVSPTPSLALAATPSATAVAGAQNVYLPYGVLPKESYEPIALPARYYEDITKSLIP